MGIKRVFRDDDDDDDQWQPEPGESPAEREKRIKREKWAQKTGQPLVSQTHHSDTVDWQPEAGESPAEREKRIKKEKWAAKMNGVAPAPAAAPVSGTGSDEWQPAPGESPAEREKRLKREKRQQQLNAESLQEKSTANDVDFVPMGEDPVEREKRIKREKRAQWLAQKEGRSLDTDSAPTEASQPSSAAQDVEHRIKGRSWLASNADEGMQVDQDIPAAAAAPKPPKEKTKAKLRYLRRKKLRRKARTQSRPNPEKRKNNTSNGDDKNSDGDDEGYSDSESSSDDSDSDSSSDGSSNTSEEKNTELNEKHREDASASEAVGHGEDGETKTPVPTDGTEESASGQKATVYRLPAPRRPEGPQTELLESMKVDTHLKNVISVDPSVKIPVDDLASCISAKGLDRLREMGIHDWFAVQSQVIPLLCENNKKLYLDEKRSHDVCVSAPTGSGKTLSYAVPIVEALRDRVRVSTRALVILPTRELVFQVRDTFASLGKGTSLRFTALMGRHSFAHEQQTLFKTVTDPSTGTTVEIPQADVVITTPGRLMDHLNASQGSFLNDIRFLVVDEADRLLTQSYYGWIHKLMSYLDDSSKRNHDQHRTMPPQELASMAPVACHVPKVTNVQKLLLSATLTRDPVMTSVLQLYRPIYISVGSGSGLGSGARPVDQKASGTHEDASAENQLANVPEIPQTLKESYTVVSIDHKPLYALYLIENYARQGTLCFANTIESAKLLADLLDIYQQERQLADPSYKPVSIKHFSSVLSNKDRAKLIDEFNKGDVQVLISSDVMARGLDLNSVGHVLNYDMPTTVTTYVHRVGRTARAGREGDAITICNKREAKPFRMMMQSRLDKLKRLRIKDNLVEPFVPFLQTSLEKLNQN